MGDRKKNDSKKARTAEWPLIKPKANLRVTRIKDNDLITVDNLLTPAESKAFITTAESIGFVHQGSLGPTKGEAYRDNDRISVTDPALADTIWNSGLNKLYSDLKIRGRVAVGLNPNIRFYRYKSGQRFGRHIDESVDLGDGKRTHYTLLIYLSGGTKVKSRNNNIESNSLSEPLVGGETVFYGARNALVAEVLFFCFGALLSCFLPSLFLPIAFIPPKRNGKGFGEKMFGMERKRSSTELMEVPPTEGMALLHIHGDKCMLHEARNVSKGVKYVLRSDVVFA